MSTLSNSEDPDEMQHNVAFHQAKILKNLQGQKYIHEKLETSTCDPLKYKMGNPILIVSICMGKSIRIQRVN